MTVADRIKEKRMELNMSQTELAKKAGYSDKTSISKIESSGDEISLKKVNRIADALNVSTAYLMGWERTYIETGDNKNRDDVMQRLSAYISHFSTEDIDKLMDYADLLSKR